MQPMLEILDYLLKVTRTMALGETNTINFIFTSNLPTVCKGIYA